MTISVIRRLQSKYPEKTLSALDPRTALVYQSTHGKDIDGEVPVIHVRKPRSRESIVLSAFDEELELFLAPDQNFLFYMPGVGRNYPAYDTNVEETTDNRETVCKITRAALVQSLIEQGRMKIGETRIFWSVNQWAGQVPSHTHTTVMKMRGEYRVVAELGSQQSGRCTTLISESFRLVRILRPDAL